MVLKQNLEKMLRAQEGAEHYREGQGTGLSTAKPDAMPGMRMAARRASDHCALERRRPAMLRPVAREVDLRDLATVGPARGALFDHLRLAVRQHHVVTTLQ